MSLARNARIAAAANDPHFDSEESSPQSSVIQDRYKLTIPTKEARAQQGTMETAADYETFEAINQVLVRKLNQTATQITVEVRKGHCVLRGQVSCFYETQLAQESALRTKGVRSVKNLIVVHSY